MVWRQSGLTCTPVPGASVLPHGPLVGEDVWSPEEGEQCLWVSGEVQ